MEVVHLREGVGGVDTEGCEVFCMALGIGVGREGGVKEREESGAFGEDGLEKRDQLLLLFVGGVRAELRKGGDAEGKDVEEGKGVGEGLGGWGRVGRSNASYGCGPDPDGVLPSWWWHRWSRLGEE